MADGIAQGSDYARLTVLLIKATKIRPLGYLPNPAHCV